MVRTLRIRVNTQLLPQVPFILNEATITYPDRQDDWLSHLDRILAFIKEQMRPDILKTINEMLKIGVQISNFNSSQFKKIVKQSVGVDVFQDQPWLKTQLENYASQNVQLIRSLSDDTLESIKEEILLGVQQGTRFTETAKDIQKRFAISDRRAKLIARDQTSKLNGSLTRLTQEQVGIKEYVWRTAGDERVRATHKANDGKTFRWDRPPKTGHPGSEINCRCTAIPVMDDFIK